MSNGPSEAPSRRSAGSALAARPTGVLVEAKLTCGAGPAQGSEYPLKDGVVVIGRAPENPVSVADTSVSRRHAELTKGADGWRVKDLGSGNGTLLNGDKLEAEAPLRNGDVLTLGSTELTFRDLANSTDRAVAPPPPPPRTSTATGRRLTTGLRTEARPRVSRQIPAAREGATRLRRSALLVLLVIVAAGVGLVVLRHRKNTQDGATEAVEAQRRQVREQLEEVMQAGKNYAREGEWKAALAKFEEIRKKDPTFPELAAYLDRAPKELEVQRKLEAAKQALGEGKLGPAAALLSQANYDGALYNPRLKSLQTSLENRLAPRLAEAKAALAQGDYEKAHDLVADLLKVSPDNREAQVVSEEAEKGIAAKARREHHGPAVVRVVAEARVWSPAVQRYVDGDLAGAVALANGCAAASGHCRDMLRDLAEVADLHKRIDDLDTKALKRLMQLDREIGEGKTSKLARPAALKLANALYKQASGAKTFGDWARAKEIARQVLALDPGNVGAISIIEESSRMSKELYVHAYSMQESNADEAVKLLHTVVEMTPPDDEFHRKAQKLLEKLAR